MCAVISFTYGCNDSPSKEEGAAEVPETRVVCGIQRSQSWTDGIHGMLEEQDQKWGKYIQYMALNYFLF